MKKDCYLYPAIFEYAEDGISISFPDLPGCFSCAHSDEEAVLMAKDALGLHLYSLEEDNEGIPEPTPIKKLSLEPNQGASGSAQGAVRNTRKAQIKGNPKLNSMV